AWLSGACSSSPSARNELVDDAGGRLDGSASVDSNRPEATVTDAAKSCNPYSTAACAAGQTCCITVAATSPFGTCVDLQAWAAAWKFECSRTRSCGPDEICCGTFIDPPTGDATATTFCRKTCTAPAHQICMTSADCTQGGACTALPEGGRALILAVA